MLRANLWAIMALVIAGLALSACGTSATTSKSRPAEVEPIEGTDLSRVILSSEAAERLDIKTAPVLDEEVVRTWMVSGEVWPAPVGGRDPLTGSLNTVWVSLVLSEGELNKIERGAPARVLPIDGDGREPGVTAQPVEIAAVEGAEEAFERIYYTVAGADHGFVPGQPVRVELVLSGSQRSVIPYASVIYDLNGETWAYTNPEPLVFVRHHITVDYIDGDLAVLLDGPEAGVAVVTLGAAELLGVELGVGQ